MKTLIFNGSPRINGDTSSLVKKLIHDLNGEYRIVDAYRCGISPCIDCRYCWENDDCAVDDEMQEIYSYIQECDNILVASPVYFSELTGKMLDLGSRLQRYFCARFFRNEKPIQKPKRGAVILVGGGDGRLEKAYETACTLLHHMNSYDIHDVVYSHDTNERPALEDEDALRGVDSIVEFFNAQFDTADGRGSDEA